MVERSLDGGVGNQLPILLIDFLREAEEEGRGWESVTDPLDRLPGARSLIAGALGISYRSS